MPGNYPACSPRPPCSRSKTPTAGTGWSTTPPRGTSPRRRGARPPPPAPPTLPGLRAALGGCGLTVLDRASAHQLTARVRTAFDPATRGDVARLTANLGGADLGRWLDWDTAGPVMAEERVDHYLHDSGTSVSWAWHAAP